MSQASKKVALEVLIIQLTKQLISADRGREHIPFSFSNEREVTARVSKGMVNLI